jgi:N6-adenosine-specific RNA methylase IME4
MNKKYNVILLDAPWHYNSRANHKTRFRGGVHGHYPTMKMEEIKALNLDSIADDNCALFMWCTFPYVDEQIKLFEHWGFTYKTVGFVWVKTNKHNDNPFFGVGHFTRANAELCLFGMRGKLPTASNRVSSVVIAPREQHSKKPDIVRDKIVELFGDVPRVELFARQNTNGWDCLGNDIDGRDIREVLV